jgi:hypothetical protein
MEFISEFLYNLFLLSPIALVLIGFPLLQEKYSENRFWEYTRNKNVLFVSLFAVIIIGFLTNQDNDQQWGCIRTSYPIFTDINILYSSVSLLFALAALLIPNQNLRLTMLCIELLYWLYKLFFINEVNIVGIGGVSIANVSVFEFFALVVRLQLINSVIGRPSNLNKVLKLATLVVLLKVLVDMFSDPLPL